MVHRSEMDKVLDKTPNARLKIFFDGQYCMSVVDLVAFRTFGCRIVKYLEDIANAEQILRSLKLFFSTSSTSS